MEATVWLSGIERNYKLYQSLLRALKKHVYDRLKNILETKVTRDISTYLRTSLKTLRKYLSYIKNRFIYPYNNGRMEGINNKVKVLNRVSYGYRNFKNDKNRIILHFSFRAVDNTKQNKSGSKAA